MPSFDEVKVEQYSFGGSSSIHSASLRYISETEQSAFELNSTTRSDYHTVQDTEENVEDSPERTSQRKINTAPESWSGITSESMKLNQVFTSPNVKRL